MSAEDSASLSMSHNSTAPSVAVEETGQVPLPFRLTGSQAKTAYALEKNVARMIEEAGLECCGFLTLTVGDKRPGDKFQQIWESGEASRRINSLITHLIRQVFPRSVIVTERHQSGAIHFHLIVECRDDIRSGFDFEAYMAARNARKAGWVDIEAERRYKRSATPALRSLWALLLRRLPRFGFGRAELTPIYKTGEAVSRYVSKYVEKNLFNRPAEDKRKKLVRYSGWNKQQMKPNEFSWSSPRACAWRTNARRLAGLAGVRDRGEVAACFGPRWAFRLSRVMNAVTGNDQHVAQLGNSYTVRESARQLVLREACKKWVARRRMQDARRPGVHAWRYRPPTERRQFTFGEGAEWTENPPAKSGS